MLESPVLASLARLSGRVSRTVLDAVLPPRCLKCGDVLSTAQGLCPDCWRKLTWRYGIFFLLMAGLNEAIWRTQAEGTWLLFRFPGATIIHVVFGISQVPLMMKYAHTDEPPPPPVE